MSINFVINSQLYKDSIIGAYTLFRDSIEVSGGYALKVLPYGLYRGVCE